MRVLIFISMFTFFNLTADHGNGCRVAHVQNNFGDLEAYNSKGIKILDKYGASLIKKTRGFVVYKVSSDLQAVNCEGKLIVDKYGADFLQVSRTMIAYNYTGDLQVVNSQGKTIVDKYGADLVGMTKYLVAYEYLVIR